MFLTEILLHAVAPGDRMKAALAVALAAGAVACAQERLPPCFVELPVYSAEGDRLVFNVVAVAPEEAPKMNLLEASDPEMRMSSVGSRVYFQRELIGGRQYLITLENDAGERAYSRLALLACRQRTPVQKGFLETGADVAWSSITGRLAGCDLAGDWWVRAMPMFGEQQDLSYSTGYLDPEDGSFWLAVMRGLRHIVVVGRGKHPVKVLATNVTEGGENDVGRIDLTGACPE